MIVGLTGRAGAGKDFTYKWLESRDYNVIRLAWADNLKHEIEEYLNGGHYLPALWEKPYPSEVRKLLQWWGTDLRRKENASYWIDKMQAELAPYADGGPYAVGRAAVITDTRFPNEADAIRDMGGIIIAVWAPTATRQKRLGTLPPEHASESNVDSIEARITLISENGQLRGATDVDRALWQGLLEELS